MIKCCKTCVAPKRHLCCHDTCEEYLAEKKRDKNDKAELKKINDYNSYAKENYIRIKSRERKKY